jgi:hypothetical protein
VLSNGVLKTLTRELIAEDLQQFLNEMLEWDRHGERFLEEREIEVCAQALDLYTEGFQQAGPDEDAHEAGLDRAAAYALQAGFCRETVESWVAETRGGTYAHRPR